MATDKTPQLAQGFATRLKQARQEAGLTIRALAHQVGITHQSVVAYEAGRGGGARMDVVQALADALSVSPCWLAYGLGPPKGSQRDDGPES